MEMTTPYFISGCTWVAGLIAGYLLVPATGRKVPGGRARNSACSACTGQNDQPTEDPALKTHMTPIKVDVNLVLVSVSITDPRNRQVIGLDKETSRCSRGKERREIRHFSSEDAPVSLGAIFDVSGSMADKIDRAREAVVEFFKTANPQDEFSMIAFADQPEEVANLHSRWRTLRGG